MAGEPTWFRAAAAATDRPRFGMIHRPPASAPATGVGLVIVPAFGAEAIAGERALVRLADDATRAGVVAVRVDLDGTGDSAGDDVDPGRVEAWLATIGDACELVRQLGADRVVLAGVRVGALLATLAAGRRADVVGLIAIAAVPSGRAVVRELRDAHAALGLPPPPAGVVADDNLDEVAGFALTAETRVSVAQLDLLRLGQRPAPAVLLLDRDDAPGNDAWAARLGELRAEVVQRRVAGFADFARGEAIAAILGAAVEFAAARPPLAAAAKPPTPRLIDTSTHADLRIGTTALTEELVAIGNARAIVTRAAAAVTPRRALILLDTNTTRALGPHRLYVGLARELVAASADLLVVRGALADVAAAVAWCRTAGARKVDVLGIGAAADRALDAAAAGEPIDAVIAIDPALGTLEHAAARAPRTLFDAATLQHIMSGDADLRALARTLVDRARTIATTRGRELARRLNLPVRDGLAAALLALAARHVAVHLVFSTDAPGQHMVQARAAATVDQLVASRALSLDVVADADRAFTARWAQQRLRALLAALAGRTAR